jgi:hypothetical protein
MTRQTKLTVFLSTVLSLAAASVGLADNRGICAEIVSSMGYSVSDYAYEGPGFFRQERHQFGVISCFVNSRGEFDSLYQGEIPIAVDGFFGEQVILERDRLTEQRNMQLQEARTARDIAIALARKNFLTIERELDMQLSAQLAALRAESDPRQDISITAGNTEPIIAEIPVIGSDTPTSLEPVQGSVPTPVVVEADRQDVATSTMWVVAERLSIRTCAADSCGIMSGLISGSRVSVYEVVNGWARISGYSTASCENGVSFMIDDGNGDCSEQNGIIDGNVAQWVSMQFLSKKKPEDLEIDSRLEEILY